jgi:hypothetical protein
MRKYLIFRAIDNNLSLKIIGYRSGGVAIHLHYHNFDGKRYVQKQRRIFLIPCEELIY